MIRILVAFALGFAVGWNAHARTLYRRLMRAIERGEAT